MGAFAMMLPVRHGRCVVCVGIAVVAKVRAGVVFTDVFRHDAPTGLALPGVFPVLVQHPPTGRVGEHIRLHVTSTDELHKRTVVMEALHDQPVVHAPVVFDTVTVEIP